MNLAYFTSVKTSMHGISIDDIKHTIIHNNYVHLAWEVVLHERVRFIQHNLPAVIQFRRIKIGGPSFNATGDVAE